MADEPRPARLFTFRFLNRQNEIRIDEAFALVDWLPAADGLTERIVRALNEAAPEVELMERDRDVLLEALKPRSSSEDAREEQRGGGPNYM